jgi:ABC-type amino acid transport substrate-binding protein
MFTQKVCRVFLYPIFSFVFIWGIFACSSRDHVEKRDTPYIIAQPSTWQNIKLYGTEQNITGFTSDLIFEIAQTAGIEVRIVKVDPNLFKELLDDDRVDGIVTAMPVDDTSRQYYEFTNPYFVTGTVVVVRSDASFKKLDDLKNVQLGYDSSEGVDIVLKAKPSWLLRPYESPTKMMQDLLDEKIDGVVLRKINALRMNKSFFASKIRILQPPLETENVRIAVRKGHNHELVMLFNEGVKEYIKSGKFKELLEYWGMESFAPPES